jgi:hypothetical protein
MRRFVMVVAALGLIAGPTAQAQAGLSSTIAPAGRSSGSWQAGGDPLDDSGFLGGGISGNWAHETTANGDATFTVHSGTATLIGALHGESTETLYVSPSPHRGALSPSDYSIDDYQPLLSQVPFVSNGGLLFDYGGYDLKILSNGPDSYAYYANSGYNTPVSSSRSESVSPHGISGASMLIVVGIASLMGLGFAWRVCCDAVAV